MAWGSQTKISYKQLYQGLLLIDLVLFLLLSVQVARCFKQFEVSLMIDATPTAPWSLIPSRWECAEARRLKGWSAEALALRAGISVSALMAYEDRGDVKTIGGPGLTQLRRVFELEGIVFDDDGLHELEAPSPRPWNQAAEAAMFLSSYKRLAQLHVLSTMTDAKRN